MPWPPPTGGIWPSNWRPGIEAAAIGRLVWVDEDLCARGWQLYRDRLDKDWSLTDCVSFVVMRHRAITEALTADRHFEQAGFIRLIGS